MIQNLFSFHYVHATAAIMFGLACVSLPARASEGVALSPVINKTTLVEARAIWAANGAIPLSEGHLAIGGGSGVDGLSKVALDKVLLVTVSGVDFEGLSVARYAFVDEVLYGISSELRAHMKKQSEFKDLTKEELAELEQALIRKYGKPRGLKDFVEDKKPSVLVWDLRDSELTLAKSAMHGYHLSLRNKALAKKVDSYKKEECKKHRQQGNRPTAVTDICL